MRYRDGDWVLFDYDIQTGRQVWSMENPDGSTTFRTDYPVQPTVDLNTAQRNLSRSDWAGDYHQIASIPLNVYHEQLADASKQDDQRFLSSWLNDSDNAAWRTKEGTV